MSVIKESKMKAGMAIDEAIDALTEYMNELEADEFAGPLYDGSDCEYSLSDALYRLNFARTAWHAAHGRFMLG